MTAGASGQAAREELLAAQRRRDYAMTEIPWDQLPDDYRADWETIAQAAIAAAGPEEIRAAMAETRKVLGWLDDFTHAVIDYRGTSPAITAAAKSVRKKAGLPPVDGK